VAVLRGHTGVLLVELGHSGYFQGTSKRGIEQQLGSE